MPEKDQLQNKIKTKRSSPRCSFNVSSMNYGNAIAARSQNQETQMAALNLKGLLTNLKQFIHAQSKRYFMIKVVYKR